MTQKKFEVLWSPISKCDLESLIEYISVDSPARAEEILAKIELKCLGLSQLPEQGRIVPELQEKGFFLYRELIVIPWRILYRISDKMVFILGVFDSRRDFEDILSQRMGAIQ